MNGAKIVGVVLWKNCLAFPQFMIQLTSAIIETSEVKYHID